MTNAEKYKDAIMAQMCKTGDWAVKKITEDIMRCGNCTECLFDRYFHCGEAKAKWLKEHSVPI